jgi:hypothetical protein
MPRFCVLEPPDEGDTPVENALVIKDGFSVVAFLVPLLWFLWHRMWLEAAIVLAISAVLGATAMTPSLQATPVAGLLVSLFAGMEARNLLVEARRRRGWRDWGVIVAPNRDEAEIRYIAEAYKGTKRNRETKNSPASQAATKFAPNAKKSAFGLIDYPRKG